MGDRNSELRSSKFSRLDKATLDEYREAFSLFDKNGDGSIEASELYSVMKSINVPVTEEEVKEMIGSVDADGDGNVNFNDFVSMMLKEENNEEVIEAFNLLDKDHNGVLDRYEIKEAIKSVTGVSPSESEVDLAMKDADLNEDGVISLSEFKTLVEKQGLLA